MPALSLLGGPTLQIMAPAFPKVGTGSVSIHCALFAGAGVKVGARGPCTKQGSWAGLGWPGWAGRLVGWLVDTKSPVTNHQPPTHWRPQSVCLDGHVEELPLEHVVHPIVPAVPEAHLYRSCCTYLQNFFRAAAPWNCW